MKGQCSLFTQRSLPNIYQAKNATSVAVESTAECATCITSASTAEYALTGTASGILSIRLGNGSVWVPAEDFWSSTIKTKYKPVTHKQRSNLSTLSNYCTRTILKYIRFLTPPTAWHSEFYSSTHEVHMM